LEQLASVIAIFQSANCWQKLRLAFSMHMVIYEMAVRTALSRLNDRGLVGHMVTYWAVTDDAD